MTAQEGFDRRLTPARADLAAAFLEGKVHAERFVAGERFTVAAELADIRKQPRADAPLDTQVLHGETLVIYDEQEGWGWGQSDVDGYVGYVAMSQLRVGASVPTHRIAVNRTFVYPGADMKLPPRASIPLNGLIAAAGSQGDFTQIANHGFVFSRHLAPLGETTRSYTDAAEGLEGAPYLWGGKSALGIDCSGLVQVSCAVAGIAMPRDTDLQERVYEALPLNDSLAGFRRGDLVFWKGHVGMMLDAGTLLHASAYHMLVKREPLANAVQRILLHTGLSMSSARRIITLA